MTGPNSFLIFIVIGLIGLSILWGLWNLFSKKWTLPCPSQLAWMVEMQNPLARHTRSESIIEFLALSGDERVLEIGCGPGRVSIPLAKQLTSPGELISLDIQSEMLERVAIKASAQQLTNLDLVCCDIHEFDPEYAGFSRILFVMSLGEIPDASKALKTVRLWLEPDGEIVVCESVFDPHFIRKKRLVWMMLEAGLQLQRIESNPFGYNASFVKTCLLSVSG